MVSALLALPSLVLAAFTGFFFDDPNAGNAAWVAALPFLTLPVTLVLAVPTSWVLYWRGRFDAAVRVASLPPIHLAVAVATLLIVFAVA